MDRQALIQELRDLAAMHEASRLAAVAENNMIGAAYFMGRVDQCNSAAGIVADRALQDEVAEIAQAIERLDSHKHGGDLLVGYAGR